MEDLNYDNYLTNFCFLGDNSIDYQTLFESQFHFLAAFKEIQRMYYPVKDFQIKIGAFNQGSFEVSYLVDFATSGHLLSSGLNKSALDVLYKSLATLVSVITIHKTLKGEKPHHETAVANDTTDLDFGNSNIFNVNNFHLHIYKDNTTVTNHIAKTFEVIKQDQKITGVKIHRKNKELLLDLNESDITSLANSSPYVNTEQKESVSKVRVYVKKVSFYRDKNKPWQWEFIFNGTSIKAVITDKGFENIVNKGETFRRGTKLVVDLKKISKWEPKFRAYLIKSYEIVKVHAIEDINTKSGQTDLFDM